MNQRVPCLWRELNAILVIVKELSRLYGDVKYYKIANELMVVLIEIENHYQYT